MENGILKILLILSKVLVLKICAKLFSRDQNSGAVRVVGLHGFDNPLFTFEDVFYRVRLAVAEFDHDFTFGFQECPGFLGEATIEI